MKKEVRHVTEGLSKEGRPKRKDASKEGETVAR